MLKKIVVVAALSTVTAFAVAGESDARNAATQVIGLQDGSTAYVFPGGKMALENKYGEAVSTKPGTSLKALDGSTITMKGNDVAHLNSLLRQGEEG